MYLPYFFLSFEQKVDASTIIDRSEDAQLEAAIQASLEMKTTPKVISVLDDDVTDDDSDDNDDEDIEITDKHGSGSTNDRKRRKLNSESGSLWLLLNILLLYYCIAVYCLFWLLFRRNYVGLVLTIT